MNSSLKPAPAQGASAAPLPKKRLPYADILKGLLMFSVLLSHTNVALQCCCAKPMGYLPSGTMGLWHMPLFMAIAGYFFYTSLRKATVTQIIRNKIVFILVPCIIWGTVARVFDAGVFHGNWSLSALLPTNTLWFLWSLLLCMLLFLIPYGGMRFSRIAGHAVAILMACGLYLVPGWSFNVAYMFPFFYAGYACNEFNLLHRLRPWHVAVACAVIAAFAVALRFGHFKGWNVWATGTYIFHPNGVARQIYLDVVRLAIGFIGSIGFAGLVWHFYLWAKKHMQPANAVVRWVKAWLLLLGMFSLSVYAIQATIVEVLFQNLIARLPAMECSQLAYKCFFHPVSAILLSFLCLLCIHLLARVPLCRRYLLGK